MATTRAKANLPVNYEEAARQGSVGDREAYRRATGDRIRFHANRAFITPTGWKAKPSKS